MPYSPWQRFITDGEQVLPGAEVEVRRESDNGLATIYSDAAGSSKSNPFQADSEGLARFYAAAGRYKITATSGSFSTTFRNVQIGEAQAFDVGDDAADKLLTRDQLDGRYYQHVQDNFNATRAPTVDDDENDGYSAGSRWFDNSTSPPEAWLCIDATSGSPGAIWVKTSLTLDELGSIVSKNFGTGSSELQDNAANRAEFLPKEFDIVEVSGTSRTLQASDNGKVLVCTSNSDVTITAPDSLSNFQCGIWRYGDGSVSLVDDGSSTVNAPEGLTTIETKYAMATVATRAQGEYGFFGGLEPIEPSDIGAAYALSGYGSPTGTVSRAAWTIYSAPTISSPPTKAEVQDIADGLQAVAQHVGAMQKDLD